MKRDDYIAGRHHFWMHFWCGLVFGAGLSATIGWGFFDAILANIAFTTGVALIVALCCGLWGDSAWQFLMELFCNL